MKSSELLEKINELEKEAKLVEESKCLRCLNEQRIQRKIDEKTHNQLVMDGMIRDLVWCGLITSPLNSVPEST